MKIFMLPLLLAIAAAVACDVAIYKHFRRDGKPRLATAHAIMGLLCVAALAVAMLQPLRSPELSNTRFIAAMVALYTFLTLYLPRIIAWGVYAIMPNSQHPRIARGIAATIGLLLCGTMIRGAVVTPKHLNVEHIDITCPNLPHDFDGLRIAHWSDTHLGTYCTDTTIVSRQVDAINAEQPDIICFTGDLVSRTTAEALPFRSTLARLQAQRGIFAVQGNHDYDDYVAWTDSAAKRADREALCQLETKLGWALLRNESALLFSPHGDSIVVAGCENYDRRIERLNYSNLDKALADIDSTSFILLLQHNPQQWRDRIVDRRPVDLTLSGHTHAMQIMFTAFGHRFSPAAWLYNEWGGLYTTPQQALHVSIGTGMVGMPARIGATPTITIITLHCPT